MPKNEIKEFPQEIVEKMLDYQEEQKEQLEELDLTKILKSRDRGKWLYLLNVGEVELIEILPEDPPCKSRRIEVKDETGVQHLLTKEGKLSRTKEANVVLFPAKNITWEEYNQSKFLENLKPGHLYWIAIDNIITQARYMKKENDLYCFEIDQNQEQEVPTLEMIRRGKDIYNPAQRAVNDKRFNFLKELLREKD